MLLPCKPNDRRNNSATSYNHTRTKKAHLYHCLSTHPLLLFSLAVTFAHELMTYMCVRVTSTISLIRLPSNKIKAPPYQLEMPLSLLCEEALRALQRAMPKHCFFFSFCHTSPGVFLGVSHCLSYVCVCPRSRHTHTPERTTRRRAPTTCVTFQRRAVLPVRVLTLRTRHSASPPSGGRRRDEGMNMGVPPCIFG